MLEKELKLAIEEYLQWKTNQGVIYADRLNSGEVIEVRGKTRRRVKLCRAGTADFYFIKLIKKPFHVRLVYLECKGEKGKQSPEQGAFEILIKDKGAEYHLITSLDQVIELVEGENCNESRC